MEGQPVRQVRVKIPMTSLPPTTDIYGVRMWLGWLDPDKSQARKVREVVVRLDRSSSEISPTITPTRMAQHTRKR